MRKKILDFLDDPSRLSSKIFVILMLVLIYASVVELILDMRFPEFAENYSLALAIIRYTALAIFATELMVRVVCEPGGPKYLMTFYGLIDLIAVLPGLIGIIFSLPTDSAWVRVFRLVRFGRSLKFFRTGSSLGGVTGRLAPYFALAVGLKGLAVALEGEPWWPKFGNLTIFIGVAGFALAILLGTKLRVITGRLYAVEDAICRIVGSLRDMQANVAVREAIGNWAVQFEGTIFNPTTRKIRTMKTKTDELEMMLEHEAIGGPVTAGFHRDVEYVLHRAMARTPHVYERFLKFVTAVYSVIVIISVPGLTGFFASILFIYILGGMYLIIDDIDRPLDSGEDSFISVDLEPLLEFNKSHKRNA